MSDFFTISTPFRTMDERDTIDGLRQRIVELERHIADAGTGESQKILDALFSSSLQSIFIIDPFGRLLAFNEKFAQRFGYKPAEMLGRCIYDFLSEDEANTRRPYVESVVRTARSARIEDQRGNRWLDSALYPLKDSSSGLISKVLVCVNDITKRKLMERELERVEENFRKLFMNATEGIFQTTPEGRFLSANPALAHILGYENPDELITRVTDIGKEILLNQHLRQTYLRILNETGVLGDFECRMRKADGTIIWASLNMHAIFRDGIVHRYEGTLQDITQRKLAGEQLIMQRDLALRLATINDFQDGLVLILKTALDVSGMESGGIWLKKEPDEHLELISCIGFSEHLKRNVQRLDANSPIWSLLIENKTIYLTPDKEQTPNSYQEGFKFRVIVPILQKGGILGSLSLLSRNRCQITDQGRIGLDFLSVESGNIIARMQARARLEKEVETRREAEKALQAEQQNLQETNAALRVLLRHRETDKKELEERLVANLKQLVLPYVEKLRKSRLEPGHATMVSFIETNLQEILSPFLDNLKHFKLTPRQIEIIALIKSGKTTKEIAEALHVSKAAVDKHRFLIRKRLNLNSDKTNLRSFLLSLT